MTTQLGFLAIALASVAVGFAQTTDELVTRVLHFTHLSDPQSLVEMGTVVRSTGEIHHLNVDAQAKTITLQANSGQVALAGWLFGKLDQPVASERPGTQQYEMPDTPDGVVQIFYPAHTETVQDFQELTTVIRATAEIQRAFTFNAARAMVLRGTPAQIALASWLFDELDSKPGPKAFTKEYRLASSFGDVMRVFFLRTTLTPAELQQNATSVRSATGMPKMFTYNRLRAITMQGTTAQIARAEQLLEQFR